MYIHEARLDNNVDHACKFNEYESYRQGKGITHAKRTLQSELWGTPPKTIESLNSTWIQVEKALKFNDSTIQWFSFWLFNGSLYVASRFVVSLNQCLWFRWINGSFRWINVSFRWINDCGFVESMVRFVESMFRFVESMIVAHAFAVICRDTRQYTIGNRHK